MLEALRINKHNRVDIICDLEPLGKINVICGKNNSGKTSLLESLKEFDGTLKGKIFNSETIEDFVQGWDNHSDNFNLRRNGYSYKLNETFVNLDGIRAALTALLECNNVWYSNDYEKFFSAFFAECLKLAQNKDEDGNFIYFSDQHHSYNFSVFLKDTDSRETLKATFQNVLNGNWVELFSEIKLPEKGFLISPKRRIQSVDVNSMHDPENNTGEWILKNLYDLKNKLEGSIEKELYYYIAESFKKVSLNYEFDYEVDKKTIRLSFKEIGKKNWIPAQDCGLGLQDLLVIIYFALTSHDKWIMIEEPENHLHPELQRRLLQFLKEETDSAKQFIISTHSNVFLDYLYADSVFLASIEDGKLNIQNDTNKSEMLSLLGYSVVDNLVSDLIIIVEGSNDKKSINEFLKQLGLLDSYNIRFWILNGDFMENVDLASLVENLNVMVLLDNDPQSNRAGFLKQCRKLNIDVTILKKYSIESYYPLEIYKKTFEGISGKITKLEDDKPVWAQLGGKVDKKSIKRGSTGFAEKTNVNDLKGTDLWTFLEKIETKLQAIAKRSKKATV